MSIRTRIASAMTELRGNPLENPATPLSNPAAWLRDWITGGSNDSGVVVNEVTAMQLATVFTCVFVLSRDIATLPLIVYKREGKKRTPAFGTPYYNLITKRPNPEMTAPVFWGAWYACAILTGNGYAEIQWGPDNTPVALWLINPRTVRPRRIDNDLIYEVTGPTGIRELKPENVLHLRGLTLDGWLGLSPINAAKDTIGTAIAAKRYGAGFFGRNARPSGLLTGPELKPGSPAKLDEARDSWRKSTTGENAGGTAVLPNGWNWTKIGITPEEAQFLQTQGYTRTEIGALFGLPAHKLGDTSRLSNSNHESSAREYLTFTLRPWLVNGEAEVEHKLLPRIGRNANGYEVEHDDSQMIRGDFETQMQGLATGRQWGAVTANEFREQLKLDPVGPEGDILLVPLNMVAADSVPTGSDASRTEGAGSAGDGGNEPADDNTVPKGNGGRNQRMLLQRMETAYGPLLTDACARLARRARRDADAVTQIFGPITEVIAAEARRQAGQTFQIADDADLGQDKILRDYRKAVEKRSADWTAIAASEGEPARAIRAIVLPIFREAGGHVALAA